MRRVGLAVIALGVSLGALTGTAAAFPGDPTDTGNPSPGCGTAGGRLSSMQCQYGSLSPTELRAANAAAAAGQGVVNTLLEANLGAYTWFDYWRLTGGPVTVYDGPGGNPIFSIDEGFNFVSVISWEDDWAQINYGQWVPAQNLQSSEISSFAGVLVSEQPDRLFGWMALDTQPSRTPGGGRDRDASYILRYTPITVFAAAQADGWNWYLIGPEQWVEQRRVALVRRVARPEGVYGRWVAVDLYEQTAIAYEDDRMVFATLVSTGLPDWPTRKGLYSIWSRLEHGEMSGAEGRPDFYYLENVPWTMYFDGDISLHGTYWHDGFGYRHSHGCVNLSITDAAWFYEWTSEDTWVYVYSSGEYVEG
jgi:hypothetical protein